MRSTMLDMDSRLRVARAIEKDETQASIGVFQMLKRRGHPDGPPPTISDGWGGIDQAMIEVYGMVPQYSGRGRPPTRKKPGTDWASPRPSSWVKLAVSYPVFMGHSYRRARGTNGVETSRRLTPHVLCGAAPCSGVSRQSTPGLSPEGDDVPLRFAAGMISRAVSRYHPKSKGDL
jgi:hypothetical protein